MTPIHSSLATSRAARPAQSQDPLAAWLLKVAQCRAGPHAGAVAGCVSVSGAASYVYPEIAGYYLQWLAWRALRFGHARELAEHAAAVQRWLAHWLTLPGPRPASISTARATTGATTPSSASTSRWCCAGLGAAASQQLLEPDAAVIAGVSRVLERMIADDGAFVACLPHATNGTLPDRWSTRRGPFLAKAAAGVLRAAAVLPRVPQSVTRAAERTFTASLALLAREPHRETHPLLYAFEGVLSLPGHPRFHDALPSVSVQFDILLAHAAHDAHLPETLGLGAGQGPARVDVMAQALRVGYLLAAHRPQQPPDRVALARLRQAMSRQVRPGGGVAFARSAAPAQANVWATMFADQALAFAAPSRDATHGGAPIP